MPAFRELLLGLFASFGSAVQFQLSPELTSLDMSENEQVFENGELYRLSVTVILLSRCRRIIILF